MGTAARGAVCVVWLVALALLTTWSETTSALWAAVAVTLIAGALIGRWWVLLVPVVPALVLVVLTLVSGDGTDADGTPTWKWAAFIAVAATAVAAVLGVGVGLVRLARGARTGGQAR